MPLVMMQAAYRRKKMSKVQTIVGLSGQYDVQAVNDTILVWDGEELVRRFEVSNEEMMQLEEMGVLDDCI